MAASMPSSNQERLLDLAIRSFDDLLDRAFPEEFTYTGNGGSSGPGHHLVFLQRSQDFWDDPDDERMEAVLAEMEADLDVVADVLTARWGRPDIVDLRGYVFGGPEPLESLAQEASEMRVWRPGGDRFVALTIGHGDKELPFDLLGVIGLCSVIV
jgi:hypothetical protein